VEPSPAARTVSEEIPEFAHQVVFWHCEYLG
jgi:hypothetical protein